MAETVTSVIGGHIGGFPTSRKTTTSSLTLARAVPSPPTYRRRCAYFRRQRQPDVLIKEKAHVRDQQGHRRRLLQSCDRRPGRRCLPALRWPHLSPAQSADRRRHGRPEEGRYLAQGCSLRDQTCLC